MSRGKSARGETYEQIRRIDAAAENDNAANTLESLKRKFRGRGGCDQFLNRKSATGHSFLKAWRIEHGWKERRGFGAGQRPVSRALLPRLHGNRYRACLRGVYVPSGWPGPVGSYEKPRLRHTTL